MTTNIGTGTVLITGPTSGLGRALTLKLAGRAKSDRPPSPARMTLRHAQAHARHYVPGSGRPIALDRRGHIRGTSR